MDIRLSPELAAVVGDSSPVAFNASVVVETRPLVESTGKGADSGWIACMRARTLISE